MKPWTIYTRVSTEDQAQGASLEAQAAACRAMAMARQWPVSEDITDAGASGKSLERPGAQRVLALIRERATAGVIVWKLDRLTRSLRDLIELVQLSDANGVALVSVTESIDTSGPMGRFTIHLLGAIAQLERETISQRTRLGMAHRRAQGAFLGGNVPAGLTVIDRGGLRVLAVHPEHGAAVRRLWPMVLEGATLSVCRQFLTERGVPTQLGRGWVIGSVSQILANPRYVGLLVDQETHDQVQQTLARRGSPGNRRRNLIGIPVQRPSDRVWRLHGIAACARCGMALAGDRGTGSKGKDYYYLRCTGRLRNGDCKAPLLSADAYEEAVIQRVVAALTDAEGLRAQLRRVAAEAKSQAAGLQEDREALILRRDGLQRKLEGALDAASEGGAVARAWGGRIAAIQTEMEGVVLTLATLEGRMAAARMTETDCDALLANVLDDVRKLPEMSWENQKKHLRAWVRQVRLDPETIEVDLSVPDVSQVRTGPSSWLPGEDSNLRPSD